jgi:hypothetical protein
MLVLDEVDVQCCALAALCMGRSPDTHGRGGWVGPRGCSGRIWRRGSLLPPLMFKTQTILPVMILYTDRAVTGVCV